MRPLALVALVALAALAPPAAAEQRVELRDGAATPPVVLATDWETVRFVWPANETHALVDHASGEAWCEPSTQGCIRFFPAPGRYEYACAIHPEIRGAVLVERGSGGDAAAPLHAFFVFRTQGLSVTLDASAAAQSRTAIETFLWDFGDGTNGTGRVVEHAYDRPGTYVVRLTLVDELGNEDTNGRRLELRPPGDPAAYFWANATGRSVLFEAPPNASVVHRWDFGDGSRAVCPLDACQDLDEDTVAASSTSLVHVYRRGGTFVVNHSVMDGSGAWRSSAWPLSVRAPETFDVRSDGLRVDVDASTLDTIVWNGTPTYEWLFGDLARASGVAATHEFPQPGLWSIELTLRDSAGNLTLEREVLLVAPAAGETEPLVAAALEPAPPERATPLPLALLFAAAALALLRRSERYK